MKTSRALIALTLSLLPLGAMAAPVGSSLLAMVPEDAQIVSGLKVTSEAESRSHLSLVTHNNNVDFGDWVSMVSVDPQLCGRELVEAASSSPRGELTERLLLADGCFDAKHIFRAALEAGATSAEFAGVPVLIVLPSPRDEGKNVGVRWLAIPDDRTALFGTPLLMQRALSRRAAHAQIDAGLAAHLKEIRPGADDWTLFVMPPQLFERHMGNTLHAAEAIQVLTGSDDLVMGIRDHRSTATIDFVAHPEHASPETAASLNAQVQLLAARLNRGSRVRLDHIVVEKGRVTGTLTVTEIKSNDNPNDLASR